MAEYKYKPLTDQEIQDQVKASYKKKPKMLILKEIIWKHLIRSVLRSKNVMLVGHTGSGKTFTAECVKVALERPWREFNLGNTQDPRITLIGQTTFKNKETTFQQSRFPEAIQTPGMIVFLDELTRASKEAWNILMSPLDPRYRYLEMAEADNPDQQIVHVAEGVSFISAANIGSQYTATRILDRAVSDRFTIIEIPLLDKDEEFTRIEMEYPELDKEKVDAIADIATFTRDEVKTGESILETIISTRVSLEVAGLMNDGFKLSEAAEVAIFPYYSEEGGVESPRSYVAKKVQEHKHVDVVSNAPKSARPFKAPKKKKLFDTKTDF